MVASCTTKLSYREEINEPQSFVLARLTVYCIISSLETRQQESFQKKRTRSNDEHDLTPNNAKLRKVTTDGSDNSCSSDFGSNHSADTHNILLGNSVSNSSGNNSVSVREPSTNLKEPLQASIQYMFRVFQQFVTTDELSPKTYFVYQFLSLLIECGRERIRPVLALIPTNLVQNLLKVMITNDISVGLITRFAYLKHIFLIDFFINTF